MLTIGQTISDTDLARALQNERGTFLAQQQTQNFLVVAEEGHSIASIKQVGGPVLAAQPQTQSREWYITKVSDSTEALQSDRSRYSERERQRA